jgi:hypothetical protein
MLTPSIFLANILHHDDQKTLMQNVQRVIFPKKYKIIIFWVKKLEVAIFVITLTLGS